MCWSNNFANRHLSPGTFNRRVLRSGVAVLTLASLTLPSTRSCEVGPDACVLDQRTNFRSSQASNLLSFVAKEPIFSTSCHGAGTPVSLSAHLSIEWECTTSQNETHFVPAAQSQKCGGMWKGWRALRDSVLSSPTNSPAMTLPRTAWVRLNRLGTGVGHFRSCLYKLLVSSPAAYDCGAEEQTVDHVVLQCPIHRPPVGLHGLTVLDDETIEWLLNTCPEIKCDLAVLERTGSNDEAACCVLCRHYNPNQPRCAVFCVEKSNSKNLSSF